jgi:hypothetical protein
MHSATMGGPKFAGGGGRPPEAYRALGINGICSSDTHCKVLRLPHEQPATVDGGLLEQMASTWQGWPESSVSFVTEGEAVFETPALLEIRHKKHSAGLKLKSMDRLPPPNVGVDLLAPLRERRGALRIVKVALDPVMGHLALHFVTPTPLEALKKLPPTELVLAHPTSFTVAEAYAGTGGRTLGTQTRHVQPPTIATTRGRREAEAARGCSRPPRRDRQGQAGPTIHGRRGQAAPDPCCAR